MKLLEDGNREREAVLNLEEKESCCEVTSRGTETGEETKIERAGSYQVGNDFLEELSTFLHLVLRAPQLDDVTLLRRVGEIDNDLEADEIMLVKLN